MTQTRDDFAESVMRRLDETRAGTWATKADGYYGEGLMASAASTPQLGHPGFVDLALGESGSTEAVAMFLDLRKFTARSFWDSPEEVLSVNVAVITELAAAVANHGGYVLGFRGDGVFACFDPGSLGSEAAAAFAVGAAAWAIDAVRNALNNLLELSGIEPVQVRVGMDFGRLDFVRIGSEAGSEVNVLGFAANFASRCEKVAHSWEVVAGETLAALLPPQDVTQHATPARYTRGADTRSYKLFDVNHARYLDAVEGVAAQLAGRPMSSVNLT